MFEHCRWKLAEKGMPAQKSELVSRLVRGRSGASHLAMCVDAQHRAHTLAVSPSASLSINSYRYSSGAGVACVPWWEPFLSAGITWVAAHRNPLGFKNKLGSNIGTKFKTSRWGNLETEHCVSNLVGAYLSIHWPSLRRINVETVADDTHVTNPRWPHVRFWAVVNDSGIGRNRNPARVRHHRCGNSLAPTVPLVGGRNADDGKQIRACGHIPAATEQPALPRSEKLKSPGG